MIVLASLVVIILPALLDFDGEYQVDTRSKIPQRPDIEPIVIADPGLNRSLDEAKTPEQLFGVDAAREAVEQAGGQSSEELKPQAPELSGEGVPVSWLLQIASFSEEQKARSILQQLQRDGYRAYSESSTAKGKTMHRVYVGPKFLKQDLLDEKAVIEQKYQLKTLLLRLEP